MGEEANQIFRYMNMKKMDSNETSISSFENSENSIDSISSSDLVEDATSPWSSSSSSSNGSLCELSEIMAQLPIKRGLSKHYHGKSQSFTSLANVRSIEDFPKKVVPFCIRAKMKACKRYGWGVDGHHNKAFSPKATISKKGSGRVCFMSSLAR